jgi:hypothetical protein
MIYGGKLISSKVDVPLEFYTLGAIFTRSDRFRLLYLVLRIFYSLPLAQAHTLFLGVQQLLAQKKQYGTHSFCRAAR